MTAHSIQFQVRPLGKRYLIRRPIIAQYGRYSIPLETYKLSLWITTLLFYSPSTTSLVVSRPLCPFLSLSAAPHIVRNHGSLPCSRPLHSHICRRSCHRPGSQGRSGGHCRSRASQRMGHSRGVPQSDGHGMFVIFSHLTVNEP